MSSEWIPAATIDSQEIVGKVSANVEICHGIVKAKKDTMSELPASLEVAIFSSLKISAPTAPLRHRSSTDATELRLSIGIWTHPSIDLIHLEILGKAASQRRTCPPCMNCWR